jgi:hypothetical protein
VRQARGRRPAAKEGRRLARHFFVEVDRNEEKEQTKKEKPQCGRAATPDRITPLLLFPLAISWFDFH